MSDSELPRNADVLRVLRPIPLHLPVGATKPTWEAMNPTEKDKLHSPVRVSVWDKRRTSPTQAIELRAAAVSNTPGEPRELCSVFAISVADILEVAATYNEPRVRVVNDPGGLLEQLRGMPGSDGHSGIEGLDRINAPRKQWKAMLLDIAMKCWFVHKG